MKTLNLSERGFIFSTIASGIRPFIEHITVAEFPDNNRHDRGIISAPSMDKARVAIIATKADLIRLAVLILETFALEKEQQK